MANFRERKSFGPKKSFGNNKGNFKKSFGSNQKYSAVCASCGDDCNLPFKPTGNRPVYCSSCFSKQNGDDNRFSTNRNSRDNDSYSNKKFSAVCSSCGEDFQLPFRPIPGKEFFCDRCFDRTAPRKNNDGQCEDKIKKLEEKIDRIIKLLTTEKKTTQVEETIELPKEKKPKKKKPASVKKTSKK